jgi:RNA polymerase sigma-70 factor, ECF subfamily
VRTEIGQVVQLIQRKDAASVEEALRLLQDMVFSFSMRVCGQRQDAEDTMQEVLFKSVPYLPKFDSPKALAVWLYRVAKNRCLMTRRKSKFAPTASLSLEELMPDRREMKKLAGETAATPETSLLRRESAARLKEAVQKLPPAYRLILVLHDMEELSKAEIAAITGLRLGTVRVRLHRARLFVRKELAKPDRHRAKERPERPAAKAAAQPVPRVPRCKELFAELSGYLDDELDDSLCEELEKHLHGCAPCQAFLATLQGTIEQCRAVPGASPDPHAASKLRREVLSQYQAVLRKVSRPDATETS